MVVLPLEQEFGRMELHVQAVADYYSMNPTSARDVLYSKQPPLMNV